MLALVSRFHQIQQCVSNQSYYVTEIPSRSQPGLIYEVYAPFADDPVEDYVCSCEGFNYRGRCAHQDMAAADRCLWSEAEGPEKQSPEQRATFTCPRCGGETFQTTVEIE
jgi:hypothetical protein